MSDDTGIDHPTSLPDVAQLRRWCAMVGLHPVGIVDLERTTDAACAASDEAGKARQAALSAWLAAGFHGEMDYLAREPQRRADPAGLRAGTRSIVMVALDYAPAPPDWIDASWQRLSRPDQAYVSVYARGRDYHKLLRGRLQNLADLMSAAIGHFGYRAFCDSAPVMEVALAEQAALGWRGKHTLLLNRSQGSMFFLAALYTDLPIGRDESPARASAHCGTCTRCIDLCPTGAIVAPYRLDARRCISYLTIELKGAIPPALRPLIGNRIYGCDDCQLACPWNGFARAGDPDFAPRHGLERASLVELFGWTETEFDERTRGSPIRRIGHERWLRNIAVALGNVGDDADPETRQASRGAAITALRGRLDDSSALVREHVAWALARLA